MLYLFAFLSGLLTKYVDLVEEHGLKAPRFTGLFVGVLYGATLALVVDLSSGLLTLSLAVIASLIFTGKIDSPGHILGVAVFGAFILFSGFTQVVPWAFAFFFAVSFSEEMVNSFVLDRGRIRGRVLRFILSLRPMLEVSAFSYSSFTGEWIVWFTLLSYDAGYIFIARVMAMKLKKKRLLL